jgi:hypothetical protein
MVNMRASTGHFPVLCRHLQEVTVRASESCLERDRLVAFPVRLWNHPLTALGNFYCRTFHKSISRPVQGRYQCWKCLREFQLKW